MNNFYVMVGVQGAGKTTFTKQHPECIVICLDNIRAEVFGDASVQMDGFKIFMIGKHRIEKALADGKDVIYDATNLTRKYRKWCLETNAKHIAVFVNTPLEECKQRNASRERKVPEEILDKAYYRLQPPTLDEGFDEIIEIK